MLLFFLKEVRFVGFLALATFPLILVFLPLTKAEAHAGPSWEAIDGEYTIDLGYDPFAFTTGSSQRFDFLLWRGATTSGEVADYSHVWVRIVNDTGTVLATGVFHQPLGPTTLLYEFTKPGLYTLETSFRTKGGDEIATAEFSFSVTPTEADSASNMPAVSFMAGLVMGGLISLSLKRLIHQ